MMPRAASPTSRSPAGAGGACVLLGMASAQSGSWGQREL